MSEYNGNELNSWLSIWIYPRITMRRIQQKEPDDLVIILACFAGFSEMLVSASKLNLGDHIAIPVILAMADRPRPVHGHGCIDHYLRFVVVDRFLVGR